MKLGHLKTHKGFDDSCLVAPDPLKKTSNSEEEYHAAISNDLDKMILMISQKNIYKVNIETKEITRILGTNIKSLQLIDNQYGYAIVEDTSKQMNSGLKIFLLNQLLNDDTPIFYDIDPSLTGVNSIIDFSADNQRLAYLKTYD